MTTEGDSKARVTVLAGSYRIKGDIEIIEGARITDFMLDSKAFFVVTNAEVWDLEGRKILAAAFLNINRDQVVLVAPE